MNIAICDWKYLFDKEFNEHTFVHKDSRLLDRQTKIAISVAKSLYEKVKGEEISPENIGIVLLNETGPVESIWRYNTSLKENGYISINPSQFPNIMSATLLSRISIELKAKGPCVPLLSHRDSRHALVYVMEQISAGRCKTFMIIHIAEGNNCFGCFMGEEDFIKERGMKSKLNIVS